VAGVLAYNELKQHVQGVYVPERDRKKGEGALLQRSSTVEGGVVKEATNGKELVTSKQDKTKELKKVPGASKAGSSQQAGGASDAKNKA